MKRDQFDKTKAHECHTSKKRKISSRKNEIDRNLNAITTNFQRYCHSATGDLLGKDGWYRKNCQMEYFRLQSPIDR